MTDIPTKEPQEITAGDYVQWKITLADYSAAASWVLSYTLVNSAGKIGITASASGSDFLVTLDGVTTGAYAAGLYKYQTYVTKGSERHTVGSGEITVNPNFAAATTLDTRSVVKRTLDAIDAVIEKRASQDQQEYTIGGRSLKKTPMADLIMLRSKYAALYAKEQNAEKLAKGLGGSNKILTRL